MNILDDIFDLKYFFKIAEKESFFFLFFFLKKLLLSLILSCYSRYYYILDRISWSPISFTFFLKLELSFSFLEESSVSEIFWFQFPSKNWNFAIEVWLRKTKWGDISICRNCLRILEISQVPCFLRRDGPVEVPTKLERQRFAHGIGSIRARSNQLWVKSCRSVGDPLGWNDNGIVMHSFTSELIDRLGGSAGF